MVFTIVTGTAAAAGQRPDSTNGASDDPVTLQKSTPVVETLWRRKTAPGGRHPTTAMLSPRSRFERSRVRPRQERVSDRRPFHLHLVGDAGQHDRIAVGELSDERQLAPIALTDFRSVDRRRSPRFSSATPVLRDAERLGHADLSQLRACRSSCRVISSATSCAARASIFLRRAGSAPS